MRDDIPFWLPSLILAAVPILSIMLGVWLQNLFAALFGGPTLPLLCG